MIILKPKYFIAFFILVLVTFVCVNVFAADNDEVEKKEPKKEKLNLMIVAHPDDEILWGGNQLIKDKYMVVCVTCGTSEVRDAEFKSVMKETGDSYKLLGYVDTIAPNKADNWSNFYFSIQKDIKKIIDSKDWNKIVTHNPDGEYGHIHHILVNRIVTEVAPKKKLYYFGKYYTKDELAKNNNIESISDESYNKKIELLNLYTSQKDTIDYHIHTIKYEKIISYDDWRYDN